MIYNLDLRRLFPSPRGRLRAVASTPLVCYSPLSGASRGLGMEVGGGVGDAEGEIIKRGSVS